MAERFLRPAPPPTGAPRRAVLAGEDVVRLVRPGCGSVDRGLASGALKVGDTAPDFLLPDAYGRLVSSERLRQKGAVVVSFIRGDWCAVCASELRAWHAALRTVRALGAHPVVITPDIGDYARDAIRRERVGGLDILVDVDQGLSLAYGLLHAATEAVRADLKRRGIDLADRHGGLGLLLPLPATFVIDRQGGVRHAYVQSADACRESPGAVLKVLRDLSAASGRRGAA